MPREPVFDVFEGLPHAGDVRKLYTRGKAKGVSLLPEALFLDFGWGVVDTATGLALAKFTLADVEVRWSI